MGLPTLSFRLLGPLSVERNGVPAPVGGARPRAVLAFLLTRRNRVTSLESIIEAVWDDDPPQTATAVVQVYVSQIRRAIAEAPGQPSILLTSPPGYRLRIDDGDCDAGRFDALRREAGDATTRGDTRETARLLRLALAEWRGPALADLQHYRFAAEVAAALAEERLTALENRIEADLRCGEERQLVGELTELTMTNPYRERFWEQLVLALYRSGRQRDALAEYQRMRTLLQGELGIDPNARLRELEAAVLRQDPELDQPRQATSDTDAAITGLTISTPRVVGILLTEVERSTLLWQRYPSLMPQVMLAHHAVVTDLLTSHHGRVTSDGVDGGDSLMGVFSSVVDAVVTAGELQRALDAQDWPGGVRPRVRMAVHAGTVVDAGGNIFGSALHRCAGLRTLAHGDQILVSGTAASLAAEQLPDTWALHRIGRVTVPGFEDEEDVFQLDYKGEASSFPPLRTLVRLPTDATPFVGRRGEVEDLAADVSRHRLVTLSGIGGSGKTRLAIQVARVSAATFTDGVIFVDLSAAATATDAYEAISAAVASGAHAGDVRFFSDAVAPNALLVLDDLQDRQSADHLVSELLATTTAHLLATSRAPLGIPGEVLRPLAPLSPADAVALFRERAVDSAPDVEIEKSEVSELVDLLGRVPLAIELAAARLRLMNLASLRHSATTELAVLSDVGAGRPERHRSVTAQLNNAWSELTPTAQHLLTALSVFRSAASVDSITRVTGRHGAETFDALDELVGRGIAHRSSGDDDGPRFWMLELVRSFVTQQADPQIVAATRQAHAQLFLDRGLSGQATYGPDRKELRAAFRAVTGPDADTLELSEAQRLALGQLALRLGWFADAVALLLPLGRRAIAANALGMALVRRNDIGDLTHGRRLLAKSAAAGDADAAAALGGTYKGSDPQAARHWYETALAIDPDDPYVLGNLVELQVVEAESLEPVSAQRHRLEAALAQRRSQAFGREDLPWSWFDSAKFALLLGDDDAEALHCLLRAVTTSTHNQQLATTLNSLRRVMPYTTNTAWASGAEILRLAEAARSETAFAADARHPLSGPVVVLAGASQVSRHESVMTWLEPLATALPQDGGTLV